MNILLYLILNNFNLLNFIIFICFNIYFHNNGYIYFEKLHCGLHRHSAVHHSKIEVLVLAEMASLHVRYLDKNGKVLLS